MKIIPQITEENFEKVLHHLKKSSVIDLQETSFIDPYGMIALLDIGKIFRSTVNQKILYLPESEEVLKYLERMDFFKIATRYFTFEPSKPQISEKYLRSSYSDVLLEITPKTIARKEGS